MFDACALNVHDPVLDRPRPVPRLALGGGFAGGPPFTRGPAEILPFPIDRMRRATGALPHDEAAAAEPPSPAIDTLYWRDWMREILDKHPALAFAE
jgi:hypothetical protein